VTRDFADFLESLNREGVAYFVIGGIAVLASRTGPPVISTF
jgi:hypothetical protein